MNPSQPIDAPRALILAGPNGSGKTTFARVQHCVRMGGHNIPEPVIRRRFEQGWSNFQNIYKELVDSWQIYDATKTPPVLIDEGGQA